MIDRAKPARTLTAAPFVRKFWRSAPTNDFNTLGDKHPHPIFGG